MQKYIIKTTKLFVFISNIKMRQKTKAICKKQIKNGDLPQVYVQDPVECRKRKH